MTLTLQLTPEVEQRLREAARERGISVEEYAHRLLELRLKPPGRSAEAVALLQSWIDEGDAEEQKETGDYLIQALDGDRLSDRRLFPPELEGVTW